jgi:hypothetical protein
VLNLGPAFGRAGAARWKELPPVSYRSHRGGRGQRGKRQRIRANLGLGKISFPLPPFSATAEHGKQLPHALEHAAGTNGVSAAPHGAAEQQLVARV